MGSADPSESIRLASRREIYGIRLAPALAEIECLEKTCRDTSGFPNRSIPRPSSRLSEEAGEAGPRRHPFATGPNDRILNIRRRESSPSVNAARRCNTLLQITPSPSSNRTYT